MEPDLKTPIPPKTLSRESRRIWRDITGEWVLDTQALIVLKVALESYDRLQSARQEIERDGVTVDTPTGYKREHPSIKVEKQSRDGFLASWRLLGLNISPPGEVGRPAGGFS
jgi:P27 family predicted phage terminase small subunit